MSEPEPGSGLREQAPRSDFFAIAALIFAVVAAAFSVAALVLASQAKDNTEGARDSAQSTVAPTTQPPGMAGPARVSVTEREFAITLDVLSAPAGALTFAITNVGKTSHEFVVIRTDHDAKALPVDQNTSTVIENGAGDQTVGKINQIKPGASKSAMFALAPGPYVLICNIAGHYRAGMSAPFTVT